MALFPTTTYKPPTTNPLLPKVPLAPAPAPTPTPVKETAPTSSISEPAPQPNYGPSTTPSTEPAPVMDPNFPKYTDNDQPASDPMRDAVNEVQSAPTAPQVAPKPGSLSTAGMPPSGPYTVGTGTSNTPITTEMKAPPPPAPPVEEDPIREVTSSLARTIPQAELPDAFGAFGDNPPVEADLGSAFGPFDTKPDPVVPEEEEPLPGEYDPTDKSLSLWSGVGESGNPRVVPGLAEGQGPETVDGPDLNYNLDIVDRPGLSSLNTVDGTGLQTPWSGLDILPKDPPPFYRPDEEDDLLPPLDPDYGDPGYGKDPTNVEEDEYGSNTEEIGTYLDEVFGEGRSFDPTKDLMEEEKDKSLRELSEFYASRGMANSGALGAGLSDIHRGAARDQAQAYQDWRSQSVQEMAQGASMLFQDYWKDLTFDQQQAAQKALFEYQDAASGKAFDRQLFLEMLAKQGISGEEAETLADMVNDWSNERADRAVKEMTPEQQAMYEAMDEEQRERFLNERPEDRQKRIDEYNALIEEGRYPGEFYPDNNGINIFVENLGWKEIPLSDNDQYEGPDGKRYRFVNGGLIPDSAMKEGRYEMRGQFYDFIDGKWVLSEIQQNQVS